MQLNLCSHFYCLIFSSTRKMHELTLLTCHKESKENDYFNRKLYSHCEVKCAELGCTKILVELKKL